MPTISGTDVEDVRIPGPETRPGSGEAGPDEASSMLSVVLRTDTDLAGYGLTVASGRDAAAAAATARHIAKRLVGWDVDEVAGSLGLAYRTLAANTGTAGAGRVARLATGAVLNAVWDLAARAAGKPLWRFVSDLDPTDLVAACDFRSLSDVLTPHEAVEMLERLAPSRATRIGQLRRVGYPTYASIPGRLGHAETDLRQRCDDAVADGWHAIKLEVDGDLGRNKRRLAIARQALGSDGTLLIDAARQRWSSADAIPRLTELARFGPLWIDGPTSPDDPTGHAAIRAAMSPVGVATGGRCDSRVAVKRMLTAAAVDYCRIDACGLAGVNEIVPVQLMAAKFGVPVCYADGGAGPGELAGHMAVVDFVCVSGSLVGRLLEHVDVLHRHVASPPVVDRAWYRLPDEPGHGARMHPRSVATYRYPDGTFWRQAVRR